MTLNEYIDRLVEFREEENAGDLQVICYKLYNSKRPRKCVYNSKNGTAIFDDNQCWDSNEAFVKAVNAICLN